MTISSRIRPQSLWLGLGIAAVWGAAYLLLSEAAGENRLLIFLRHEPLDILAYAVAFYFCIKILADYRAHSDMQIAWILMAASMAVAMLRHAYEWSVLLAGWNRTSLLTSVVSLRQIPIALSLILLTAALVAMWSSFASIGLGLLFRRSDALLLIVILALVPSIFSLRENMSDARSVYPLIRHLQSSSPQLLAAPALVALVLHRISQEMGSGQLAISLRFLVASLVLRLLALMVAVSPALASIKAVAAISSAVFFAAPFLFALGVVYRWRLTLSASALADRYEENPHEAIGGLSEVLARSGPEQSRA